MRTIPSERSLDREHRRWTWWAAVYMAALFAQSSIPDEGSELGQRVLGLIQPELHNLLHVPAYGMLTWLWWKAFATRGWKFGRSLMSAMSISIGYGALEEVHQYFVPGRSLSFTDLMLNALGALLCALLVSIVPRLRPSRFSSNEQQDDGEISQDDSATREPLAP